MYPGFQTRSPGRVLAYELLTSPLSTTLASKVSPIAATLKHQQWAEATAPTLPMLSR